MSRRFIAITLTFIMVFFAVDYTAAVQDQAWSGASVWALPELEKARGMDI